MFKTINNGIFFQVSLPAHGQQDIGISPGGCMDRFAFETGNALLDNPPDSNALEIIYGPHLEFEDAAYFILTGAKHEAVTLQHPPPAGGHRESIFHARVYFAPAGCRLSFGEMVYGFRAYLCWRKAETVPSNTGLAGRDRGEFAVIAQWPDNDGCIRVLKGPEHRYLENPGAFTAQSWKIASDSNNMGLRLLPPDTPVTLDMGNMVSSPVSDGTIQLTPRGPIVLLKHRQTIGGYPRIFNVISADVDLLAQYAPGQCIRFKEVSIQTARAAARQKQADLAAIGARYRENTPWPADRALETRPDRYSKERKEEEP